MPRASEKAVWDRLRATAFRARWLSCGEERELIALAQAGDRRALEKLCESHLRLVVQIAYKYLRPGVQAEDLVSEGSIGLIEAIARFDLAQATRLSTYAAWWIRAHVRMYVFRYRNVVTPPSTAGARVARSRLYTAERVLFQRCGRTPTTSELAGELGVREHEVWEAREAPLANVSLDGTGAPWEPRDTSSTPEEQVAHLELSRSQRRLVRAAITSLDERERQIIDAHFLREDASLADLGTELGVSRQRVSQIVKNVCKKLERDLRSLASESTL